MAKFCADEARKAAQASINSAKKKVHNYVRHEYLERIIAPIVSVCTKGQFDVIINTHFIPEKDRNVPTQLAVVEILAGLGYKPRWLSDVLLTIDWKDSFPL